MDFTFAFLNKTRSIFIKIIEENTLEVLNKVPNGFNNNIIWNIAHCISAEQGLTYGLSGLQVKVPDEIIANYKKGTRPESFIAQEQIDVIKELLKTSIKQTEEDYKAGVFNSFNPYVLSTTGNTLSNVDDALQFVAMHDGLHYGYILALLKVVKG
ncbi:DinB family protein [Neotamlana laminarinivorans]|uniref:DinB family protein n=1 Tax=Neotamlana laminarinivorans TaxID=2883124 RepID=A0A9X1HYC6_9FLAO|nr:DinB family protein [Tamlana laminarinivorans]MCB4798031.1 DinB family protein [Tamlana laminarinivorans]